MILEPDISQDFSISSLFTNPHSLTLLKTSTPLGGPLLRKLNVLHFNMRETYYAMSTNTILPLPPSQIYTISYSSSLQTGAGVYSRTGANLRRKCLRWRRNRLFRFESSRRNLARENLFELPRCKFLHITISTYRYAATTVPIFLVWKTVFVIL